MSARRARFARRAFALAMLTIAATCGACGGGEQQAQTSVYKPAGPTWSDAFDTTPELLAVVHPQALKRDAVYGPLLTRLSQLAAAKSAAAAATRSLEAFESSDEVLAALGEDGSGMIVMRGVRADLDPARVVDADGHVLWRAPATSTPARVPEYQREERGTTASLFVLPERTWVIAVGDARARARDAFAHPSGRPAWKYDRDALVSVRLSGPALIKKIPKLRATGQLDAIGHKLQTVTLSLQPGKEGSVTIALVYADEESAATAEVTSNRVIEVVRRNEVARFRWLVNAVVSRDEPRVVVVRAPLPKALLDDFARGGRDVGDEDLPSPSP